MNYISQQQKQARKSPHELLISAGIWFAILCWGGAYVAARFLLHPARASFWPGTAACLALCCVMPRLWGRGSYHTSATLLHRSAFWLLLRSAVSGEQYFPLCFLL